MGFQLIAPRLRFEDNEVRFGEEALEGELVGNDADRLGLEFWRIISSGVDLDGPVRGGGCLRRKRPRPLLQRPKPRPAAHPRSKFRVRDEPCQRVCQRVGVAGLAEQSPLLTLTG